MMTLSELAPEIEIQMKNLHSNQYGIISFFYRQSYIFSEMEIEMQNLQS